MGAPFEFIFNTPSHHRVHHGRNPFCIDKEGIMKLNKQPIFLVDIKHKTSLKNYAGVLIIWDRMFGTFESEFFTEDGRPRTEEVKYGLVQNVRSFDPTYVQFGYLQYVF